MYVPYNPNPMHRRVGDCTVRALSKVLAQDWHDTYLDLAILGYIQCDMPSANAVWGSLLKSKGYKRYPINAEESEYTVEDFCRDHPSGTYLLALESHVIAVCDGCFYDTWDSGNECPIYFWTKRKDEKQCTTDTE